MLTRLSAAWRPGKLNSLQASVLWQGFCSSEAAYNADQWLSVLPQVALHQPPAPHGLVTPEKWLHSPFLLFP